MDVCTTAVVRSAAEVTLADVVAAAAVTVDGAELPDDPELPLPEPPAPLDPVDGSWPASASARVSLACASDGRRTVDVGLEQCGRASPASGRR